MGGKIDAFWIDRRLGLVIRPFSERILVFAEHAKRVFNDALRRLDGSHLRRHKPGKHFGALLIGEFHVSL